MGRIVIVGGELSSSLFSRWYRVFDQRGEITLLADTHYPAFYRGALPLLVSGDLDVKEALAFTTQYLSLISDIKFVEDIKGVKVFDKTVALDHSIEVEYDKLIIASGTDPLISGYPLRNVEDALRLKDIIKGKSVKVYGGLQGLWAGEVLSSKGFNVEVFTGPNAGFYREYFDDDIWNLALKHSEYRFKLTNRIEQDSSLKIIYGYERARLPVLNVRLPLKDGILTDRLMRVKEDIYALGPVSRPRDEVLGFRFIPLSDCVVAIQGVVTALSMFKRDVRGV